MTTTPATGTWTEMELAAPDGIRLVRRSRTRRVQGRWTTEERETVRYFAYVGAWSTGGCKSKSEALDLAREHVR